MGPIQTISVDDFVQFASTQGRIDALSDIGKFAFPEYPERIQRRVVADFVLLFAHCWGSPYPFQSTSDYLDALERHVKVTQTKEDLGRGIHRYYEIAPARLQELMD